MPSSTKKARKNRRTCAPSPSRRNATTPVPSAVPRDEQAPSRKKARTGRTVTAHTTSKRKDTSPEPSPEPCPISNLPLELITLVIQQLEHDVASLKGCSLVCHGWRRSAQRYLFTSITLVSNDSCHEWNRFLRTSDYLGPYVRKLILRPEPGTCSFLNLRGATNVIERCPGIRELEIDTLQDQWHVSGQEFVVAKLKSVEILRVKGQMSGVDFGEILRALPALRIAEFHPERIPVTSRFRKLSRPSSPGFDSSRLRVLKLGWLTRPPGYANVGGPNAVPLLETFCRSHGPQIKSLTVFGVSVQGNSEGLRGFGSALSHFKNVEDITLTMSLKNFMYRDYPKHLTANPVGNAMRVLNFMAPCLQAQKFTLKLALRADDIGSESKWKCLDKVLADPQKFPSLRAVQLQVQLIHRINPRPEQLECHNSVAAMKKQIRTCMHKLLSSNRLHGKVTSKLYWYTMTMDDPIDCW
ncbi:hypothetical protein D9758_009415 [Tetrapyrgos nigripes]|uniref:F-box domain-containing protein n=1 Tax=Tetrapyrgos nigripes TaxID=182062 RepID=A0A8H5D3I1_9AGAR|nr:hypothetical protein D9758_009415 [Tetrapyrgos nigripes]